MLLLRPRNPTTAYFAYTLPLNLTPSSAHGEGNQQWTSNLKKILVWENVIREVRRRTWLEPAIDSSRDNCCAASSVPLALVNTLIPKRDRAKDSATSSWRKTHASITVSRSRKGQLVRARKGREMRHCMLLKRHKGGRGMNNNADCGMMSLPGWLLVAYGVSPLIRRLVRFAR